jgi:hypothetical protein
MSRLRPKKVWAQKYGKYNSRRIVAQNDIKTGIDHQDSLTAWWPARALSKASHLQKGPVVDWKRSRSMGRCWAGRLLENLDNYFNSWIAQTVKCELMPGGPRMLDLILDNAGLRLVIPFSRNGVVRCPRSFNRRRSSARLRLFDRDRSSESQR